MASSNIDQPWMFRSTTSDSWYPTSDAFARETESALTKALQQSLFNTTHQPFSQNVSLPNHLLSTNDMVEQQQKQQQQKNNNDYYFYNTNNNNNHNTAASASTITVSGSGSEPETPRSRPKGNNSNNNIGVLNGKTTKRKSRASKRSMTTFIQADPANFRQMVQQITGVKLDGNVNNNGQFPASVLIKPETVRQPYINNKLQGLLPTLDTSAYLLDHHNNYRGSSSGLAEDGGVGNDFYAFSCFPTLESSI